MEDQPTVDGVVAASDPRVVAILTSPDSYFADARLRARVQAQADIDADLGRRARSRRDGGLRTGTVRARRAS